MDTIGYTILQIEDVENVNYVFRDWDRAKKEFSISDYTVVYQGEERKSNYKKDTQLLERLFCKFNMDHPDDFMGRSLSMSDVVVIGNNYYYCDTFGWKKITKYVNAGNESVA